MPIYEYECPNCGPFEEKRKMSDPGRKRCPTCRYKVEQIYSPVAIAFKGTGWYVTDYKNKTAQPKGERTIAKLKNSSRVSQSPGESPRWASD